MTWLGNAAAAVRWPGRRQAGGDNLAAGDGGWAGLGSASRKGGRRSRRRIRRKREKRRWRE